MMSDWALVVLVWEQELYEIDNFCLSILEGHLGLLLIVT